MSPYVTDNVYTYIWTGDDLQRGEPRDGCPSFTLRPLDYWQLQECLAQPDAVAQIRRTLELGLVAVDGDAAGVGRFVANPHARMVVPVYQAISGLTLGN